MSLRLKLAAALASGQTELRAVLEAEKIITRLLNSP